MAALTARRCNPVIRQFAQRLEAEGKEFKVVITACMRKLLVILNSMVKSNSQWNPFCLCEPLDAKHSRFVAGDHRTGPLRRCGYSRRCLCGRVLLTLFDNPSALDRAA